MAEAHILLSVTSRCVDNWTDEYGEYKLYLGVSYFRHKLTILIRIGLRDCSL